MVTGRAEVCAKKRGCSQALFLFSPSLTIPSFPLSLSLSFLDATPQEHTHSLSLPQMSGTVPKSRKARRTKEKRNEQSSVAFTRNKGRQDTKNAGRRGEGRGREEESEKKKGEPLQEQMMYIRSDLRDL